MRELLFDRHALRAHSSEVAEARAGTASATRLYRDEQGRLRLSALAPLQDIDLAVAEARFAVHDLGALTLVLPSHLINSRPIYDRYYDPLWAAAQEMDVAVSFHGNHAAYAEHLARRYLDNLVLSHACGQPVEMMLALGSLLTGGVFARFPGLKAAFLEGSCSWVPWWLWSLDERVDDAVEVMRRLGARAVDDTALDDGLDSEAEDDAPAAAEPKDSVVPQVTVPVVEEQLEIAKRQVSRGGLRINSQIVEEPVEQSVSLREERLVVEAAVQNRDVGFISEGQTVRVKVEAFNFTLYGLIEGKVLDITRDAVSRPANDKKSRAGEANNGDSVASDGESGPVYLARVALSQDWMMTENGRVELTPGMAVTAEIQTGERRLISFLLSPLTRHVSESMRER